MDANLSNLKIDRNQRRSPGARKWVTGWIVVIVLLIAGFGVWQFAAPKLNAALIVEVERASAVSPSSAPTGVILNATGYIVAAHEIELASKVIGKVSWIGVDKGDRVKEGDVLVRLEDDEYQANVRQARGQLINLQAKLDEAMHGSRPEEIAEALANLNTAKADLENARVSLERARNTVREGLGSQQALDDAQGRYDSAVHKVSSLEKAYELMKLGPRQEQIDSLRGQVEQAKGALAYAETNLENTIIRAPVTGTILERAVEKGEFVTTSFVGDKGAKGYVVSIADLNDLEVELDISQSDFAKLHSGQRGTITTDAFPDLKYAGYIKEISPEANRQKATVQVKVKVEKPDEHLRPEMNASVAFLSDKQRASEKTEAEKPVVMVRAAAVHEGAVFVVLDGRAVRRAVKTGAVSNQNIRIEEGLIGGEDVIVNAPSGLKDGDKVRTKA